MFKMNVCGQFICGGVINLESLISKSIILFHLYNDINWNVDYVLAFSNFFWLSHTFVFTVVLYCHV